MKTFLLSLLLFVGITTFAQQKNESITIDGLKRTFIVYTHDGVGKGDKLPVIISFHGRLGTAERQMSFSDFRPIADREKIVIVCPQGVDRSWNDGRGTPAHEKGINDVKFIDQLISFIINNYQGDASRIYVTGMSNGGFMSSRLACQLSNRIAAIAVVAASMDQDEGYAPTRPVPVMYIQGTADPLVPFAGGIMQRGAGGNIYGHEDVLKVWVAANKCNMAPVLTSLPTTVNDGTSVVKEEFTGGKANVIGYKIVNGGHTWPDGSQYLPKIMVGKVSHNLNASQVIWDFFKDIRLPATH